MRRIKKLIKLILSEIEGFVVRPKHAAILSLASFILVLGINSPSLAAKTHAFKAQYERPRSDRFLVETKKSKNALSSKVRLTEKFDRSNCFNTLWSNRTICTLDQLLERLRMVPMRLNKVIDSGYLFAKRFSLNKKLIKNKGGK